MGSPATTFVPTEASDATKSDGGQCVPTSVSDMFFNMQHSGYDRLYDTGATVTEESIAEAILQDAKDMVGWLSALGISVNEDSLVKDFLKRL